LVCGIGTANVEHQWVKNVQKNPRIELSVGGEKFEAEARFLADPAKSNHALAAAGRKFWPYSPVQRQHGSTTLARRTAVNRQQVKVMDERLALAGFAAGYLAERGTRARVAAGIPALALSPFLLPFSTS
jgi:hypothetical protein